MVEDEWVALVVWVCGKSGIEKRKLSGIRDGVVAVARLCGSQLACAPFTKPPQANASPTLCNAF